MSDDLMFIPYRERHVAVPARLTTGDTITGASVNWVREDLHEALRAERDALRTIIASDKPREELLWARAHVAELEAVIRRAEAATGMRFLDIEGEDG